MPKKTRKKPVKEFELISEYLQPLASGFKGALSLKDDVAILPKDAKTDYIITLDTIVEDTHFLRSATPAQVANKLIRSNLSDIASSGGTPKYYFLTGNITKDMNKKWFKEFTGELAKMNKKFNIHLAGGDTVKGGNKKFLSATMIGVAPKNKALLRSTAKKGDDIYVSGIIGEAWVGLNILKGAKYRVQSTEYYINRHYSPIPRLELGKGLIGIATACTDVSDGLLKDLNNILKTSNKTATLDAAKIPLAITDKSQFLPQITAGDDYELVFTAPASKAAKLALIAAKLKINITRIGKITEGNDRAEKITIIDHKRKKINFKKLGYEH